MSDERKELKWYHQKRVRVTAGVLAAILLITAAAYPLVIPTPVPEAKVSSSQADANGGAVQESAGAANAPAAEAASEADDGYAALTKLVSDGAYEEALSSVDTLLQAESSPERKRDLLGMKGALCYRTGRFKEAAEVCDELIGSDQSGSTDGSVYFVRGVSRIETGQYEDAWNDLKETEKCGFEDAKILDLQLALAAYLKGDYKNAGEYAEKASKEKGTEGASLTETGQDSPLFSSLLPEESRQQTEEQILYIAAISRMQMEDFEGSLEWFDRLADVKEDAEVFYYRGVANMALEKYEEAAADFEKALALGKDDTAVHYDLGVCLVSGIDPERGKSELEIAASMKDDPDLSVSAENVLAALSQNQ